MTDFLFYKWKVCQNFRFLVMKMIPNRFIYPNLTCFFFLGNFSTFFVKFSSASRLPGKQRNKAPHFLSFHRNWGTTFFFSDVPWQSWVVENKLWKNFCKANYALFVDPKQKVQQTTTSPKSWLSWQSKIARHKSVFKKPLRHSLILRVSKIESIIYP